MRFKVDCVLERQDDAGNKNKRTPFILSSPHNYSARIGRPHRAAHQPQPGVTTKVLELVIDKSILDIFAIIPYKRDFLKDMGILILEDQIFDKPRVPVHLKIMVKHLRRHYGLPNFLRHWASPKNVINILTNSPTVVAVIN
nr:hypothetical protein Iba_chr10cCG12210 [Ipomoea batatas]